MDVDGPRAGSDQVSARERWAYSRPVAAVLVLLLVVGVAAGAWALTRPDSTTQQQADARPDAVAAASRFATSVNTYDVADLTAYNSRVTPLLTASFAKQFKASTEGLLSAYAKTKLKSTGKVRQAAVESIDSDSAKVLVAVDAETVPAGLLTNPPRLRWQVSLVKQHGRWLVDDFTSVEAPTSQTEESAK
jgi:Mce-associated membrane protein